MSATEGGAGERKAVMSALDHRGEGRDMVFARLLDSADRLDNPQHRGNQFPWPDNAQMLRNLVALLVATPDADDASEPCVCGTGFTCLATDHDHAVAGRGCPDCSHAPGAHHHECTVADCGCDRGADEFPAPDASTGASEGLSEAEFNGHGDLAGRIAWDRKVFTEDDVLAIVAARESAAASKALNDAADAAANRHVQRWLRDRAANPYRETSKGADR